MIHKQGTFVYRLAGRDRQQSASYYTPEVLTRSPSSAGPRRTARRGRPRQLTAEILDLTICEPALGSGAFAIEAINQLADRVPASASRRSSARPSTPRIPGRTAEGQGLPRPAPGLRRRPQRHRRRARRDLAVARHHGPGLQAPWFGLHLRRGNSLIGARRATVRPASSTKKTWLNDVPEDHPLTDPETAADRRGPGGAGPSLPAARRGLGCGRRRQGRQGPRA